jgi:hypothetical protein
LDKLATISGKIDMEISEKVNTYLARSNDFATNTENVYKKIRQLSKQLMMDFD